jgi:hypothetical protein
VPVLVSADGHKYESTIVSVGVGFPLPLRSTLDTQPSHPSRRSSSTRPGRPHHDAHHTHELDKIIKEIHNPAHDPNDLFVLPSTTPTARPRPRALSARSAGRQKALDTYAPTAPAEFKSFLEGKQRANGHLLAFFTGNPDVSASRGGGARPRQGWTSIDGPGDSCARPVDHPLRHPPPPD